MKNRFLALLAAFVVTAISCHESHAQFSRLSFGKYGVESLWPESMSSLAGSVWVEVTNSGEGFSVSQVKGTLYKEGKAFISGSADSFRISRGTRKCVVKGRANLCEGVSLWEALTLVSFDPEAYTADISMRVTMDSGASRVIVKKGVKLSRFL